MKLTCDLCGGELEMNTAGQGAVCKYCGLTYSAERLKEKWAIQPPTKPVVKTLPVTNAAFRKPSAAEMKKAQKRMTVMWIILAAIGLFVFLGALFTESALLLVSIPALLITLFIFKPWKVYGGKVL